MSDFPEDDLAQLQRELDEPLTEEQLRCIRDTHEASPYGAATFSRLLATLDARDAQIEELDQRLTEAKAVRKERIRELETEIASKTPKVDNDPE